jgi:pyruvate, orthophosphate dikinase
MRMRRLGLPVPEGFVITTEACASYTSSGDLPRGLMDEVREHPARLEDATGRGFGDPANPLLVSIRSGAPISMPGLEELNPMLGLRGCRLGLLRPEVYLMQAWAIAEAVRAPRESGEIPWSRQ